MKLAYEEEVSRINNNPEFEYPLKLRMGMRFSDFNELKYAIQNEALQRGLPINLYGRHYHPSIEKWHLFAFYCKVCGARLNFYNVSGDYVAGTLNVHHVHGEMQLARFRQRRVQAEAIFLTLASRQKLQKAMDRHKLLKKIRKTSSQKEIESMVEDISTEGSSMQPMNRGYVSLKQWVEQHGYYFYANWNSSEELGFPETVILASPAMKMAFARFGDLLAFEILEGFVYIQGQSWHLGLFVVADTNSRPLLAGVGIFPEQSAEALIKTFYGFYTMHKKYPQTVLTQDIHEINLAVAQLKRQMEWNCNHLYDTGSVVRAVRAALVHHKAGELNRFIMNLNEALHSRKQGAYESALRKLQNNEAATEAVEDLIERKKRLFFCEIAPIFSGFKRDLCTKISEIAKPCLREEELLGVVQQLLVVDAQLLLASSKMAVFEGQDVLSHDRLRELQRLFEKEVVHRFIENLMEAKLHCNLEQAEAEGNSEGDSEDSEGVNHVRSDSTDTLFRVQGLRCECKEFDKTGVACPHIILVAEATPDKSFVELINRRWLREEAARRQG